MTVTFNHKISRNLADHGSLSHAELKCNRIIKQPLATVSVVYRWLDPIEATVTIWISTKRKGYSDSLLSANRKTWGVMRVACRNAIYSFSVLSIIRFFGIWLA